MALSNEEIVKIVEEEKIILILRGIVGQTLIDTVEACYRGGIRLCEITYNAEGKPRDEEVAENIAALCRRFGDEMQIGAGTVLTEKQVALTKAAGGRFIISPDTNPAVIRKTKELGLLSMPGAMTPSEASLAHREGADFVKLFPIGEIGGPSYLKALSAPLSHIRFLAVGGVKPDEIGAYLAAGAKGFGVASNILNRQMIAAGNFDGIAQLAAAFVQAVKKAK